MSNSKQLAGLIGPILAVITLSEIVNPHIWTGVTAPAVYQAGLLAFVAGFSIIRVHNYWTTSWPVTITLIGWFGIFGGLGRMFATESAMQAARNTSVAFTLEIVLLAIGLFLTFKAYGPGGTRGN